MRTWTVLLLCSALAAGCSRSKARAAEASFDGSKFVIATLQTTMSEVDLAVMAARRGRLPETRQLGAIIHRQQGELQQALIAIAAKKRMGVPTATEPRKRALKENLDILPGQVFDRAYALAMIQDFDALIASFEKASRSDDKELATFARDNLPRLKQQRQFAAELLDRLGGSPFG